MNIQAAPLKVIVDSLRSGKQNLLNYIEESCNRLDAVDPQIQAFLPEPGRRERLQREALDLQSRFPDPSARPALYGVLVGVKDIYNVDGFPTRAGSELPPELFKGREATVVTELKASGALILGKTVTSEFAYFEPGPTRNPRHLDHTPGGSSSGSAAAVAAGLCPVALGTQTIGSVIRPAAFCGVVGFKPSYGRIPTDGIVPISISLDHVGLFTQDIDGLACLAPLLCLDWRPGQTGDPGERLPVLGVPEGPYLQQASSEGLSAFEAQVARLEKFGYRVVRTPVLDDISVIAGHNIRLMSGEMAQVHKDWFTVHESLYRPRTAGLIRDGQAVNAQELAEARLAQMALRNKLERAMQEAEINLWVCPAAPGPAPIGIESTGSPVMNLPWTFAGLPTLTLPAGTDASNLPLGLQCVAPFQADEQLLHWAARLSEALR